MDGYKIDKINIDYSECDFEFLYKGYESAWIEWLIKRINTYQTLSDFIELLNKNGIKSFEVCDNIITARIFIAVENDFHIWTYINADTITWMWNEHLEMKKMLKLMYGANSIEETIRTWLVQQLA